MSILRVDQINNVTNTIELPVSDIVLRDELQAHNIGVEPTGNLVAEDVQGALEELQDSIDTINLDLLDKQPLDATLTALASVDAEADEIIYATGEDEFSTTTLTPFARTLLDADTAADARTILGISTSLTRGTAQATTSGTAIDFTGLPAGIKRLTFVLGGVSTNGTGGLLVQIGSSTMETSGYSSAGCMTDTGATWQSSTAGFTIRSPSAANAVSIVMTLINLSGNLWVASFSGSIGSAGAYGGGIKTLSGPLDRIRLTSVSGTETFDAGAVNILYEV